LGTWEIVVKMLVLPVLTFAFVRTGLRGRPNQLNSLSPPCEMVEIGSKAGYEKA
jgi:hypothetical protein